MATKENEKTGIKSSSSNSKVQTMKPKALSPEAQRAQEMGKMLRATSMTSRHSTPTPEEFAAQVEQFLWAMPEVPTDRLEHAFKKALNEQSKLSPELRRWPVNAADVKNAWEKIRDREAREREALNCSVCNNTGIVKYWDFQQKKNVERDCPYPQHKRAQYLEKFLVADDD